MIISPVSEVLPFELVEDTADILAHFHPRPPGLHLSQIIGYLMETLYPQKYGGDLNEMKTGLGSAWERVLERAVRAVIPGSFRPAPVQCDGIWCSPDGLNPSDWSIDEFKLTWYSFNKPCPTAKEYWPWLVQIKGYCKVLEASEATLRVFFVNGNYYPPTPRYGPDTCFRLKFTKLELEENWDMIKLAGKDAGWL